MSSDYDATEFVDRDFQAHKSPRSAAGSGASPLPAPTREEVDSKVAVIHQELADRKRKLEESERELAALEEVRRRQIEFQTGRQEMIHNLTRGLGLLEEAEFNARRDAEQMAKAMLDLREALSKIETIHEETWTQESLNIELTRALTTLENARMEWNAARLKLPVLDTAKQSSAPAPASDSGPVVSPFGTYSFGELCRLGFALTWPVALVVALVGIAVVVVPLLLHH